MNARRWQIDCEAGSNQYPRGRHLAINQACKGRPPLEIAKLMAVNTLIHITVHGEELVKSNSIIIDSIRVLGGEERGENFDFLIN